MRRLACGWLALVGCGPRVVLGGEGDTTGGIEPTSLATSVRPDEDEGDEDAWDPDLHMQDPPDVPPPAVQQLDILVVIDNSATMGPTQEAVVRGLVGLVGQLEESELPADVQMMFTTTDMGHALCDGLGPGSYVPAEGAPTTTGCNARLDHFTSTGIDAEANEALCTDFCPADVVPGDPFVAFASDGSGNVDAGAAAAVGCLAPQGISGCGYEAPLEAMLQALDPDAWWNAGARPFMRRGSELVVVIATDEADCSMSGSDWMFEAPFGEPGMIPPSAVCWRGGVVCDGPDAFGVYGECTLRDMPLHPLERYEGQLAWLANEYDLDLAMVAITGVPPVTAHNPAPPYEPIAGGIHELVVHDWRDGVAPEGDMLPDDEEDAPAMQELFGIGPGCVVATEEHAARAIPNHRVNDVCRALDDDDPATWTRCCIESACDPIAGLDCILGWAADAGSLVPGG
jgi:hypothetical protein